MGITWPLLAVGLRIGTMSSQFELDTDTPDALCPELGMAREAVAKRLGALEVDGGGTWRGRYRIVHDPSGRRCDYVALSILDPQGAEQLKRELPIQGESCATLAQAMALIIDGYFRDLGQSLPEPVSADSGASPVPTLAPVAPPPQLREPAAAKPSVATTPPTQSGEKTASLALILGGGMESVPRSAAATLGLLGAVTTDWHFTLRVGLPLVAMAQSVAPGQARLYSVPLRLGLAWQLPLASNTHVFIGPEVLASVERGWTEGLDDEKPAYRAAIGIGGHLGLAQRLTSHWTVAARVAGDAVLFNSSRFMVQGKPVLEASRARWSLGLELWGAIFR